eukprot:4214372-Prymnesium_polylepis.2
MQRREHLFGAPKRSARKPRMRAAPRRAPAADHAVAALLCAGARREEHRARVPHVLHEREQRRAIAEEGLLGVAARSVGAGRGVGRLAGRVALRCESGRLRIERRPRGGFGERAKHRHLRLRLRASERGLARGTVARGRVACGVPGRPARLECRLALSHLELGSIVGARRVVAIRCVARLGALRFASRARRALELCGRPQLCCADGVRGDEGDGGVLEGARVAVAPVEPLDHRACDALRRQRVHGGVEGGGQRAQDLAHLAARRVRSFTHSNVGLAGSSCRKRPHAAPARFASSSRAKTPLSARRAAPVGSAALGSRSAPAVAISSGPACALWARCHSGGPLATSRAAYACHWASSMRCRTEAAPWYHPSTWSTDSASHSACAAASIAGGSPVRKCGTSRSVLGPGLPSHASSRRPAAFVTSSSGASPSSDHQSVHAFSRCACLRPRRPMAR